MSSFVTRPRIRSPSDRKHFAAFHEMRGGDTLVCLAVVFDNDGILRDVHQTPGQIPRVRSLERRIGRDLCALRAWS